MEPSLGYVLGAYPVLSETFVSGEMRAMAAFGVRVTPMVFDLADIPDDQSDAAIHSRARSVAALPEFTKKTFFSGVGNFFNKLAEYSFNVSYK